MSNPHLALVFGLAGNCLSFLVYLAPLPTFYRITKKKSTEGFHSIPYSVALFSAMLLLYYALLKTNAFMLITINAIGIAIESIYLFIFLIFAPTAVKIQTIKLLALFNFGAYGLIIFCTSIFFKGAIRITVVGWICAVFSVSVFAAPLSVIRLVIKTKSPEFLPFSLSFSLTLCAVMWFFYGLYIRDYYIALPNTLGFAFGVLQMGLYIFYKRRSRNEILPETTRPGEEMMNTTSVRDQRRETNDLNQADHDLDVNHDNHHDTTAAVDIADQGGDERNV
ncbi:bidirectional sugar transporter SWEET14-like [Carica papaya]|uniref:bidirectional sugar transporter SWEET14-like n=1 Tax=Carica papaya TaxID=3649 RepID=UPI000B8CB8EA|nr:bidirectional sugar transporter SWEET14-like [Carica papaya]